LPRGRHCSRGRRRRLEDCSRRAQDFAPRDSPLLAFEMWKLWRSLSRCALTEFANDFSADLSSDMRSGDLRRTTTWAARSHCVAEHALDLGRASTWPRTWRSQQMKTPSKQIAKSYEKIGVDLTDLGGAVMPRAATWVSNSPCNAEHAVSLDRTASWPKASKMQQKTPSKKTVKRALIREQMKTPSDHVLSVCQVSRW
jgi:hypothetical protein